MLNSNILSFTAVVLELYLSSVFLQIITYAA